MQIIYKCRGIVWDRLRRRIPPEVIEVEGGDGREETKERKERQHVRCAGAGRQRGGGYTVAGLIDSSNVDAYGAEPEGVQLPPSTLLLFPYIE